ncbi:hypothetical protein SAMD00019534_101520 [Acytostelium subglobosum LB1]|uniref:hypothetical protein n=1 Tax=Acytostelium subglobosum LB1 TaxID=1410327 RepID=UPI0006452278|nr:hypothetical protein SAMD00019534_101520 [Acytostelium subglobosum LB1]GAM26977.1 hypothetical protein SAMD00019534_101520 [Acytostelium subglobosum LB1]|eukprot:XP_012750245.1 hypothetical protein SAMD00019534_101520 [Acytostelium subglobosum LB1]
MEVQAGNIGTLCTGLSGNFQEYYGNITVQNTLDYFHISIGHTSDDNDDCNKVDQLFVPANWTDGRPGLSEYTTLFLGNTYLPVNRQPAATIQCNNNVAVGRPCIMNVTAEICVSYPEEESSSNSWDAPGAPNTVQYCSFCDGVCFGVSKCHPYPTGRCVPVTRACGQGEIGFGIFEKEAAQTSLVLFQDVNCTTPAFDSSNKTCETCLSGAINGFVGCSNSATRSTAVFGLGMMAVILLLGFIL